MTNHSYPTFQNESFKSTQLHSTTQQLKHRNIKTKSVALYSNELVHILYMYSATLCYSLLVIKKKSVKLTHTLGEMFGTPNKTDTLKSHCLA